MTQNANGVSLKKSKRFTELNGVKFPNLPSADKLVEGELAINYAEGLETISTKNESGTVVTFSSDDYYTTKKLGEYFTGENSAKTVTEVMIQKERVTAEAIIDLDNKKADYDEILWYKGTAKGAIKQDEGAIASGVSSISEGIGKAYGSYSHAEGRAAIASGYSSHAEGDGTYAGGDSSHAEGMNSSARGQNAHAEGYYGFASGASSHAEGSNTNANGSYSHAEGYKTRTDGYGAHSEGSGTSATSIASHAEGGLTLAGGSYANYTHAEGYKTSATSHFAHTEGSGTSASNTAAHAEGVDTVASGMYSHAEGNGTSGMGFYCHAEGGFTKVKENIYAAHAEGFWTVVNGSHAHVEGERTSAITDNCHSEGYKTTASGSASHAEGYQTRAISHYAHAEGEYTSATSEASHAEGFYTKAYRTGSHAEGQSTQAIGDYGSHAEGNGTIASGLSTHAEGHYSKAFGDYSHAEGYQTKALNRSEHSCGQNNISSSASTTFGHSGNTLFSVGNGSNTTPHNAFEIHQNGDIYIVNKAGNDVKLQDEIDSINTSITSHTADATIHVTSSDKTAWNNKVGYAEYSSTDKKIYFYKNDTDTATSICYVDATDFIKDGMVQNVEIKNVTSGVSQVTCLVITFNTDSGKEDINIPISDIFDASNYYQKSETSGATELATAFAGKVNVSDVDQVFDETTSASTNPVSTKAVYSAITDNEMVWANAYVVMSGAISSHTEDTDVHVTLNEKTAWGNKADGNHTHDASGITAMTGYQIASSSASVLTTDTLLQTIGKLEKRIELLEAALGGMTLVKLTSQQYADLTVKDPNTLYIIND